MILFDDNGQAYFNFEAILLVTDEKFVAEVLYWAKEVLDISVEDLPDYFKVFIARKYGQNVVVIFNKRDKTNDFKLIIDNEIEQLYELLQRKGVKK